MKLREVNYLYLFVIMIIITIYAQKIGDIYENEIKTDCGFGSCFTGDGFADMVEFSARTANRR